MRSLRMANSWRLEGPEQASGPEAGAWRFQARCADIDPELFFPIGRNASAKRQIAQAKAVCAQCPVTAECLEWALETKQADGVWGGLSETERRAAG